MASTSLQRSLPTLTLVVMMQHDQLYLTVMWEPKKVLGLCSFWAFSMFIDSTFV